MSVERKRAITTSFIYCIEDGELEKQTMLSITSLRKNGGVYAQAPIYCMCPNLNRSISKRSKDRLHALEVKYLEKDLNVKYLNYPLANKPLVCSFVEEIADTDYLIFLDSDTIVIGCLGNIIPKYGKISTGDVLVKNIGALPSNDKNLSVWLRVFSHFNIESALKASTLMTNQEIVGYWNSGVIVVENHNGFFAEWLGLFKNIYESKIVPERYGYFKEQFSLSVLIHRYQSVFEALDDSFNYHISNHKSIFHERRINSYEGIRILHYHKIYRFSTFFSPLPKLQSGVQSKSWVEEMVQEEGIYPLPFLRRLKNTFGNPYFRFKQDMLKVIQELTFQ